jgi:hypothetical protein
MQQSSTRFSASHPVNMCSYRLSQQQAAILHSGNLQRQQHAIARHIELAMHLTTSPARWEWLTAIGARLVENSGVAP